MGDGLSLFWYQLRNKDMQTIFHFRTKEQADRFSRKMRNYSILTKSLGSHVVEIFNFENIKKEWKKSVLNTAQRVFQEVTR